ATAKPTPVTASIENRRESPPVDEPSSTSQRSVDPPSVAASRPNAGSIAAAPTLEVLQQQVAACMACDELARTRKQTVFGTGNPNARLCFMGEAPGADEDRLGEPFVGRSGELLTKMLAACRLSRDDVYILNTLKCRPPGNRNPLPAESENCRSFLWRQLELIDPEFICCLGAVAAQNFLETDTPIGRLRGRVHEKAGRKVVCTYHPAYLLRNPSAKKSAWKDLQMLMAELGIEL
ncbi:MAG: uracil-DNA glycosylase, partial [Planctomycetota bacterium]